MNYVRIALLAAIATGAAFAVEAAPAAVPTGLIKVQIKLSCLPNPATLGLSDCKVLSVTPPELAPEVGPGAVARANLSKMPANWQTALAKDGIRVIVPATVEAQPRPIAASSGPAVAEDDVLVTLSCLPNPDLSVRGCQVLSTKPEVPGAAAAALSAVTQGKLDANWRTVYKVENGRVILPVHMKKPAQ
ncbi:MAG: hypothetical protein JWM33_2806 [Caulobacteraceae bacterium]|nr:hypothetical protein [Caulobacteraceae bacterium]